MKLTVCDVCGEKLRGNSHKTHGITINNGTVQFVVDLIAGEDLCYYCACEKAYEAAFKWKKEADQSVEGQRRIAKRESSI